MSSALSHWRSFRKPLLLSTTLTFLLAACSGGPEPIRIGATMSESGAYSTQGIPARDGYLLCESHVNAAGGIWGRPIEFVIHDDQSDGGRAAMLYERLIREEEVDLVMGPYGSTLTAAVAPVTEAHRMVQITPLAATSSIWQQGYEYLFMVLPPAEMFLAGLIELSASHGYGNVAIIQEDALFPRAAGSGAVALAEARGLNVIGQYTYGSGLEDFTDILLTLKEQEVEVIAMAASRLSDFTLVVQQLQALDIELKLFGTSGAVQEFYETLGSDGEYTLGLSAWEPSLDLPGIDRFVADYQQRFERMPSFHAAGAYGSCELLVEAIKTGGSLSNEVLAETLRNLELTTAFGPFKVDERGYQIANQGVTIQWQAGEKVVIWPEAVATGTARIPMPLGSR